MFEKYLTVYKENKKLRIALAQAHNRVKMLETEIGKFMTKVEPIIKKDKK